MQRWRSAGTFFGGSYKVSTHHHFNFFSLNVLAVLAVLAVMAVMAVYFFVTNRKHFVFYF